MAYSNAWSVAESNVLNAKTKLGTPVATASATSSSSITVSWTGGTGANNYQVSYGTTNECSDGVRTVNSSPVTITGLNANTTYYFKVLAYNSATDQSVSTVVNARTQSSSTIVNNGTLVLSNLIVRNTYDYLNYQIYGNDLNILYSDTISYSSNKTYLLPAGQYTIDYSYQSSNGTIDYESARSVTITAGVTKTETFY